MPHGSASWLASDRAGPPAPGADSPSSRGSATAEAPRAWTWLVVAICLLAAGLRTPWPEPTWQHIDERAFILQPLGFWSGDLNPHFFNYPTLQLYLASGLYWLYFKLVGSVSAAAFVAQRYFVEAPDLIAISRSLTTVMAVATVAVTAWLGRRIYGPAGGLAAAALLAVMPLHTRFSHLAATDVPSALWTTLAVLAAVGIRPGVGRRAALVAGTLVGLAASTKYPGVLAAVPVGAAILLRGGSWRHLLAAAAAAVAALAATAPYLWLAPAEAWADLRKMGVEHLFSDAHQAGIPPLYFVTHTLYHGLGAAALATLAVALVWRPWRWRTEETILLVGIAALALLPLAARSGFMRYAAPVAPLLAVLVARPLAGLRLPAWARLLWLAAVVAGPAYASLQARNLMCGSDTRTQALNWLRQHGGEGYRVAVVGGRGGAPGFLSPGVVLSREAYFRRSYGEAQVLRAYRLLGEGSGYPPLAVEVRISNPAALVRPPAGSGDGFVLVCRHPLCADEDVGVARSDLDWVEFGSGAHELAVYDPVDWYFLPVAGWCHVTATGPDLAIARVAFPVTAPVPSAQRYFRLRYHLLEAARQVAQGHWRRADRLFTEVLSSGYPLTELLARQQVRDLLLEAGMARFRLGKPQEALALWQQCLEREPNDPALHADMGAALARLGRHGASLEHFERAAQMAPRDGAILLNLGTGYLQAGRFAEAARTLERAVAIRADADGLSNLGWAYLLDKRFDLAQRSFRRALDLRPDHGPAARGLEVLRRR